MTATTDRCPGCGECPEPERPESVAPRHPGATQSPDGSQGATEGLRGPEGATGPDISEAFTEHLGALAIHHRKLEHGEHILGLGITCPCLPVIALSAVPHLETAPLPDASDVRPSPPARDAVTLGYDEASRVPVLLAEKAALMGDVDRLTAERDGARGMRVIATRAFETARRVLQEASGLPDDIDDPDCRDEMVLALRPRAEKAEAENARLVEEATVSAALLEIEIAKRESAEMRANRATADLDALESEDRRQDVQAKHWREVLRIRRELDGIRREMNDATEIIAKALGYRPSGLPLDGWPHLSTTGDHTPTSLAAEAAGVLAKASRLRAGIEALAAEMQSDTCPACHASYADEGSTTWGCDHTEGMQHAGDMLRALLAEGGE